MEDTLQVNNICNNCTLDYENSSNNRGNTTLLVLFMLVLFIVSVCNSHKADWL